MSYRIGEKESKNRFGLFRKLAFPSVCFILIFAMILNIVLMYRITTKFIVDVSVEQLDKIGLEIDRSIESANIIASSIFEAANNPMICDLSDEKGAKTYADSIIDVYSDDNLMRLYIVSSSYSVSSDEQKLPDDLYKTMDWYMLAKRNANKQYVDVAYLDPIFNEACALIVSAMPDSDVVIAMEFSAKDVIPTLKSVSKIEGRSLLIIDDNGRILGFNDERESFNQSIYKYMPQYATLYSNIKASKDKEMLFKTSINGSTCTVISSRIRDDLYVIVIADHKTLYQDRVYIIAGDIALFSLFILYIWVLYHYSKMHFKEYIRVLDLHEDMLRKISGEVERLIRPVIEYTEYNTLLHIDDKKQTLDKINKSARKIRDSVSNVNSYLELNRFGSGIVSDDKITKKDDEGRTLSNKTNRLVGIILLFTMLVTLIINITVNGRIVDSSVDGRANFYWGMVNEWTERQQTVANTATSLILAVPNLLGDEASLEGILSDIVRYNSGIIAAKICADGVPELCVSNSGRSENLYDCANKEWYIGALEKDGELFATSPYYDYDIKKNCVTLSKKVLDSNGDFICVFAMDYDVSELSQILVSSYSPVLYAFLVASDGTIINHPNEAYEISDYSSFNMSDAVYTRLLTSDRMYIVNDYDNVMRTAVVKNPNLGEYRVVVLYPLFSVYGNIVIYSLLIVIVFGACIFIVRIFMNRLAKWQYAISDKMKESLDTMEVSNNAKDRFVSQMSHEFRAPINTVIGMNEMIKREGDSENIKEYADSIGKASAVLLNLVNNVLDYSEMENGKLFLATYDYSVKDIALRIGTKFIPTAREKGISLEFEADGNIPRILRGDSQRIMQIVSNLVSNAIKYTENGYVRVRITSFRTNEMNRDEVLIRVSVSDTGIGIKEEDMSRIFESFERLDEARIRYSEGTGLGLSICKKLLELMGGELFVDSDYGKGTTFSFELRQEIADATPIGDIKSELNFENNNKDGLYLYAPNAKILVTDDSQVSLSIMTGLLKRNGVQVDTALGSDECLKLAAKNEYDIIFIDHLMPGVDGIETLKLLKNMAIKSRCVAMTANVESGSEEFYNAVGFDAYISKPIDVDRLENILVNNLGSELVGFKNNRGGVVTLANKFGTQHRDVLHKEYRSNLQEIDISTDEKMNEAYSEHNDSNHDVSSQKTSIDSVAKSVNESSMPEPEIARFVAPIDKFKTK